MKYVSLFDGIGAAHAAWMPLGWECLWTAEIEKFPIAVVKARFPGIPNLGDVTKITQEMIDGYPRPDVVIGGSPCQSFSVAGLRGGLADPRGNLALRFVQLVGALAPRWVVWENVPGVLSSGSGRDFGSILGALAELGYGWAYRVLDAQHFGVAQRRRRVFVVGCFGDWRRAAAVLSVAQGMRGDPPPSRPTRQVAAPDAGRGAEGASWPSTSHDPACCLTARELKGPLPEADLSTVVMEPFVKAKRAQSASDDETWKADGAVAFKASHYTRGKDGAPSDVTPPLSADADKGDQDTLVAHTSDGVVADPITTTEGKSWTNEGTTFRLRNCVQQGVDLYNQTLTGDCRVPLRTAGGHGSPALMEHMDAQTMAVRRLTPLECERLQGFPDGWTQIPWRKKPAEECPDGPRYRALGNSMAVPVIRWIGERVAKVQEI